MNISKIDQRIPTSFPLLDDWLKTKKGEKPLRGVTVLQIQHQLGNQVPQTLALVKLGLAPKNLIWIDIPYTSTGAVRKKLKKSKKRFKQSFIKHKFRVLDRYPSYQLKRVQKVFRHLLSRPPERLVVLDDGAYFLEAASCFAKQLPSVAIVEQTTRGLIKLEERPSLGAFAARFPIVNVARSGPKMTLEPPFIGRAVCDYLAPDIKHLKDAPDLRCLVLGYGAIGRQVAQFLPESLNIHRKRIHVHDPACSRQCEAAADGFSRWNQKDLTPRFHLVVGCSGRKSFSLDDRIYLKDGAILASASSGTVELARQDFIDLAAVSEFDDIRVLKDGLNEDDVHSPLRIQLVDRTVTFVNGGFPVNFRGDVNCVPGKYIQPTAVLMVAAAVQAVEALDEGKTGKVELKQEFCDWLKEAFENELGDEKHLLLPLGDSGKQG